MTVNWGGQHRQFALTGRVRPAAVIPTLELTPRKRPVASGATESLRCCAVHNHRAVVTAS